MAVDKRKIFSNKVGEGHSVCGGNVGCEPVVSIGMPVFNGARTLPAALDSLLAQSFANFELIISDNASTDKTESICRDYAARDKRIQYVRQPENIGATANFKFVFDEAASEYFMWAACDDTRSSDFLEVNVRFLAANPDYVASASPNVFEGLSIEKENLVCFALDGDLYSRFDQFFEYCWVSHGIFYSLVRTEALRSCEIIGHSFLAFDWAIDLYLASCGKIHRTSEGYTVFGVRGVSSSAGAYKAFRNNLIELPFPFFRLTLYVFRLIGSFPFRQRMKIIRTLARLNLKAAFDQFRSLLYRWYCAILKPWIRPDKTENLKASNK